MYMYNVVRNSYFLYVYQYNTEQVPGQPPISHIKPNFRLTTVVLDQTTPLVNVSVAIPQTATELALNRPATSLQLSSSSSSSPLKLKAIVLNNNLFDNKAMQSSVLRVSIDSAGFATSDSSSRRLTDSSKPTSIKVVLQNSSPLEVHSATAAKSFELSCSRGRQSSLTETCPYPQVRLCV